jgi:hypothetical protein
MGWSLSTVVSGYAKVMYFLFTSYPLLASYEDGLPGILIFVMIVLEAVFSLIGVRFQRC